jgi:transcriptional regulator with XRE-family HTH domain
MGAQSREPRSPTRPRNDPFGAWVTDLRLERKLRTDQVAAALDVNPGRISEWETGERHPNPDQMKQLLQFYGQIPS